MRIRTKTVGLAAAVTAIAVSIPTAVTAYADDPPPTPPTTTAVSTPVAPIPDPQGSGCDAFKKELTTAGGSLAGLAEKNGSTALAGIPELSTFSAALSGQLNPEVNLVGVLDNGPYNVFAPTNAAFEKLEPAQLEALKADPAALTRVLYYHMALGILGPDDIHGKLTTQEGSQITVTGKGGDLKFDDTAKVVCGGITAENAKIYMIDTVLDPANALPGTATTTTSPTSTTETTTTTSETTTSTETTSAETTAAA